MEGIKLLWSGNDNTGVAKVALQLWVRETQSIFLYSYLLIITLISIQTTVILLVPHPVFRHFLYSQLYATCFPWITGMDWLSLEYVPWEEFTSCQLDVRGGHSISFWPIQSDGGDKGFFQADALRTSLCFVSTLSPLPRKPATLRKVTRPSPQVLEWKGWLTMDIEHEMSKE